MNNINEKCYTFKNIYYKNGLYNKFIDMTYVLLLDNSKREKHVYEQLNKFINKFSYCYSYIFRGTPLLVQIFIIYFGLGQIEYLRSTVLWIVLKEPYWCAIIAFALNTGAYTSEILRSAFQTIKPGLIEAGKSLGLSSKIIFYKIQIPIAIRQSLPAYGNEIILMLKGTSLASTVTLMDLTGVAKYIISTTFKPIEVFIVAGSIYLFMTFLIHNLIKFLEKKYGFQT